ncbi:PilW family protein [Thalassotalea aquiviva]|uniref:PilW family protein n=1 Tax=Thalassotalea aquiviva TaxID=3242415 RepID=UPI00352BC636
MIKKAGFTLIELVLTLAIVGILASGFIGFLGIGSQVFIDVSNRDAMAADARFALDRLNRELQNAIPNSIRLSQDGDTQCIEFVPIKSAHFYTELAAESDLQSSIIKIVRPLFPYIQERTDRIIVAPLEPNDAYDLGALRASNMGSVNEQQEVWEIDLKKAMTFAAHSPHRKLFIGSLPVSYCLSMATKELYRHSDYGFKPEARVQKMGVLMAENVSAVNSPAFRYQGAFSSFGVVHVNLAFSRNGESIVFRYGVYIEQTP